MEDDNHHSSSIANTLKSLSCFNNHRSDSSSSPPNHKKSPSNWLKSKLTCHDASRTRPETAVKHRRHRSTGGFIMSRIGRHRRHSSEFSYDASSYALNFQEEDESAREMKFTARLPASPVETGCSEKENMFEVRVARVTIAEPSLTEGSRLLTRKLMVRTC